MSLLTLHDKLRKLGLGAMCERHLKSEFRDLFDDRSADWPNTSLAEKIIDLRAFEDAGVPMAQIIDDYRQTLTGEPGGPQILCRLPATLRAYRDAGYLGRLPTDLEALV